MTDLEQAPGKTAKRGWLGYVGLAALVASTVHINVVPPHATGIASYLLIGLVVLVPIGVVGGLIQKGLWNRSAALLILVLAVLLITGINPNDTPRARAAEGISLASAAKTALADFYVKHGRLPGDNAEAGLAPAGAISSRNVRSVAVGASGAITVTFKGQWIEGKTIVIKPDVENGALRFDCLGGTLEQRYRLSSCRQD